MKKIRNLGWLLVALLLSVWPCGPALAQPSVEQPLIEADPLNPADFPESAGGDQPAHRPALTFWCSSSPTEQGWAVRVTGEWNGLHPDRTIQLQAMPSGQLAEEVLQKAIDQGTTPDLTNHLFPINAHQFAEQGALLPLDGNTRLMQHLAGRSGEGAGRLFRSADGHLYQFPWKNNPILLQYNAQLFRRQGIRLPRTCSEFLEAGRVLGGAGSERKIWLWAPSPTGAFWERYYDFFPLFLAASGGQSLLTPQGRANFDNPAGLAVMTFLADLYRQGAAPRENLYPDEASAVRAFVEGDLAMIMTGPWNIEAVRDAGGEAVVFDFLGLPVPDGTPPGDPVFTYGNFRNFGVFKSCRNPDLAAEFIEFATNREHDLALLEAALQLPFRTNLAAQPDFVSALQRAPGPLAKFALQSPWVRSVDNVPDLNEVLRILSEEVVLCAVQGRKEPRQALRDAARRVDARRVEPKGRFPAPLR